MKYIITGQDKALGNVIREQRIRIERGLIEISPAPDFTNEDFEQMKSSLQTMTEEKEKLSKEKEELASKLASAEKEIETLKSQIPLPVTDSKSIDTYDNKDVSENDSKEVPADEKSARESDEKKVRRKKQ